MRFASKVLGEVIHQVQSGSIVLSLLVKLSDLKLSTEELRQLMEEVAMTVVKAIGIVYYEETGEKPPEFTVNISDAKPKAK